MSDQSVVDMGAARQERHNRLLQRRDVQRHYGHAVSDDGRDYGHELFPRCLGALSCPGRACEACGRAGCSCRDSGTEAA